MRAGDLRRFLATVPDDHEVIIRWNDDDCCHVAGVASAHVETGCAETPALMLDADTEEDCS